MRATAALLLVQASRAGALVTGSTALQCTSAWSSRPRLQTVRLLDLETDSDAFRAFDLGQRSIWGDRSSEDTRGAMGMVVPISPVKPSLAKPAAAAAAVQSQEKKAVAMVAVAAQPLQNVAAAVQLRKKKAVAMATMTEQPLQNAVEAPPADKPVAAAAAQPRTGEAMAAAAVAAQPQALQNMGSQRGQWFDGLVTTANAQPLKEKETAAAGEPDGKYVTLSMSELQDSSSAAVALGLVFGYLVLGVAVYSQNTDWSVLELVEGGLIRSATNRQPGLLGPIRWLLGCSTPSGGEPWLFRA